MKTIHQVRQICGGLAEVSKVRGQSAFKITFHKNYGHGKLGGDKTQGVLGQLTTAGFNISQGRHGNTYDVMITK